METTTTTTTPTLAELVARIEGADKYDIMPCPYSGDGWVIDFDRFDCTKGIFLGNDGTISIFLVNPAFVAADDHGEIDPTIWTIMGHRPELVRVVEVLKARA